MKNEYEIKYCQECKKDVAVVDDGNINGKQRYKCKVCGRQITERKYPIEVRSLAVKILDLKYSYLEVARIFGTEKSPNTIRNWKSEKPEYDIDYKQQIEILNEYKEICDNIEMLVQCEKALKYHQLEKEYDSVVEILTTQSFGDNSTILWKWTQRRDDILAEMKELGEVKYKEKSNNDLREMQSAVNKPIEELEKRKSELESKSVFLREKYDITEIIRLLKRLAKKD